MSTIAPYIGKAFKKLRFDAKMSQGDVCKALKNTVEYRSFISKIENGAAGNLSVETVMLLAGAVKSRASKVIGLAEKMMERDAKIVTHRCPLKGSGRMPCCGKSPLDVLEDRITANPDAVTCRG